MGIPVILSGLTGSYPFVRPPHQSERDSEVSRSQRFAEVTGCANLSASRILISDCRVTHSARLPVQGVHHPAREINVYAPRVEAKSSSLVYIESVYAGKNAAKLTK
jgi:hypothetical protein